MNLGKLNESYPTKTAFITGAASGLGAAFARLLAKNEWTLHLSDLDSEGLEELSKTLIGARSIHRHVLDVSNRERYKQVVSSVMELTPQVDLLINNAGIGDGELFKDYNIENWERMIQINLLGVFYGCHYFVPSMIIQGNGLIINIGSAAGFMNSPGMSAYNVSKSAVFSLSETLFHELKTKNIHVSVVTPTFFKTNIMSQATGSKRFVDFAEKQMKYSKTNAEEMAEIVLIKASQRKFHIIHPADAKRNRWLKTWFPRFVSKKFEQLMAKYGD
jgi:NADP-dependent 3-hydroxy acid dehydrogenase YdfG